jgi:hypothetical protein
VSEATELDGASRVARHPAVAEVQLDGEAVLYHEQLRTVCVLNPTATAIWSRLDAVARLDSIARDLADAFGADLEVVRRDVLSTVRDLGQRGVLADITPDPALVAELELWEANDELPDG